MIHINQAPYWDDFEPIKGYQRILFRPGVAVQARELTQLQTMLQYQIAAMGDHVFKSGSLVTGGGFHINNTGDSIKLKTDIKSFSINAESFFVNKEIYSLNTGVRAIIKMVSTEHNVFIVQYISASIDDANITKFTENEIILLADSSIRLEIENTFKSSIFKIDTGIVYSNQHFVRFPDMEFIVDPYSNTPTTEVGFIVHQRVVTSATDESLLDNAQGSFNYAAPGAHRLQFLLELTKKDIDIADERFVLLYRLVDGIVTLKYERAQYAELMDEFANRTYDKSGHFTTIPFTAELFNARKILPTEFHNGINGIYTDGSPNHIIAKFSSGEAYVKGYKVNKIVSTELSIEKSINTEIVNDEIISINVGNFVFCNELVGHWNTQKSSIVSIRDFPAHAISNETYSNTPLPGKVIGACKVYTLKYDSNDIGTPNAMYRLYLYDIKMEPGISFEHSAKCLVLNNVVADGIADIVPGQRSPIDQKPTEFFGIEHNVLKSNMIAILDRQDYGITTDNFFVTHENTTDNYSHTVISQTYETEQPPINIKNNFFMLQRNALLYDRNVFPLIHKLSKSFVKTLALNNETPLAEFEYKKSFLIEFNQNNTATIDLSSENEFFTFGTGSLSFIERREIIVVSASNGRHIFVSSAEQINNKTLIVEINDNNIKQAFAQVRVKAINVQPNKKNLIRNNAVRIHIDTINKKTDRLFLGKTDIFRFNKIFIVPKNTNFNDLSSFENSLNKFFVNNGQTAEFYDYGWIQAKNDSVLNLDDTIIVIFDFFEHENNIASTYFCKDSYNVNDEIENSPSVIRTWEIPTFNELYNLRDCIDFRPSKPSTALTTQNINNSTINPTYQDNVFVPLEGLKLPSPDRLFKTKFEFYLSKIVVIAINKYGDFITFESAVSETPKIPSIPHDVMHVSTIYVTPYPSLTENSDISTSLIKERVKLEHINNKRFTELDLQRIERRVENIEYYTSLSLLEMRTKDLLILNENNMNRFKNGFFVDSFRNHEIGDFEKTGYNCSVDTKNGGLLPSHSMQSIKFNLKTIQ